jgi:hypothetical protein
VAAWLAAAVAIVNPTLFGFTDYIWDTSVFALGVAVAVWMSVDLSARRASWLDWAAFGFYLGVLALINPALTVAYPLLVLWPLCKTHGWRLSPVFRGSALALIGWAVAIAPWTARNYIHFNELIYVRGGFGHELWLGVCPEAETHGGDVFSARFPLQNAEVQRKIATLGEKAYIEQCGEQARAAISADPWRYARLVAVRAVDFWAGTVFSHTRPGRGGWPRSPPRQVVLLFLAAESLAVAASVMLGRRLSVDIRWLMAIAISFSLVYCLTHVELRYRAPIEPVIAIIVGAFLASLSWRRAGSRAADTAQHVDSRELHL